LGQNNAKLAGRALPAEASRQHAVRHAEICRLALALCLARQQLKDNRAQLLAIVEDIARGLTSRYGAGPVSGTGTRAAASTGRSPRISWPPSGAPGGGRARSPVMRCCGSLWPAG
jgi:hypothetical protein